jgi:hypothetical protein
VKAEAILAKKEVLRRIEGIARQGLISDCSTFRRHLEALRQAATDCQWERTVLRCLMGREIAIRLSKDHQLLPKEHDDCRRAQDDLLTILRFVENNRLNDTANEDKPLPKKQIDQLDRMTTHILEIQARLDHEPRRPADEGAHQ